MVPVILPVWHTAIVESSLDCVAIGSSSIECEHVCFGHISFINIFILLLNFFIRFHYFGRGCISSCSKLSLLIPWYVHDLLFLPAREKSPCNTQACSIFMCVLVFLCWVPPWFLFINYRLRLYMGPVLDVLSTNSPWPSTCTALSETYYLSIFCCRLFRIHFSMITRRYLKWLTRSREYFMLHRELIFD